MTQKIYDKRLNFLINTVYFSTVIILIYIALRYAIQLFFPLILSFAVAYSAEPFVLVFVKKLKIKRWISSIFCILIIYSIISAVIIFFTIALYYGLKYCASSLPSIFDSIIDSVHRIEVAVSKNEFINTFVSIFRENFKKIDLSDFLANNIGNNVIYPMSHIIKKIPSLILTLIITLISTILISNSFQLIKKFILNQLDKKSCVVFKHAFKTSIEMIKNYIKSYGIIMIITFTELSVLFFIFKIKPTVMLALIISVIDILPVFGVGIILVPWALLCFFTGDFVKASILIAIYMLVTVIRQIIEPKVIGKSIGLHPLLTLFAIFLGYKLFGFIGIIFLPLTLVVIIKLNSDGIIHLWNNIAIDNSNR